MFINVNKVDSALRKINSLQFYDSYIFAELQL